MIAARILAVLAALLLVVSFALATLLPTETSLAEFVASIDHPALVAFQNLVRGHLSEWTWGQIAIPVLMRPCWLIPLALGLISAGLALTLSSRPNAARSHRRP